MKPEPILHKRLSRCDSGLLLSEPLASATYSRLKGLSVTLKYIMLKTVRFTSNSTVYFLAKANSVFLGLVFSILYSRALGPESKGILTVVFLSTVLFSQIINGGIDLSFRSRLNGLKPEDAAQEYFAFSLLSSLLVTGCTLTLLQIYAHLKVPIAPNYLIISIGYVFLAVLSEQITQFILALGNFKSLWKIEMPTIFFQMGAYLILLRFSSFSTAVCVLLSFSFSYLVIIFRGLKVILSSVHLKSSHELIHLKILNLIRISKNNFSYNFLMSLTDRFDRLIVLWVFSSSIFGKYSVATGILLTARFVPETIGNLILGNQASGIHRVFKKFKFLAILAMLAIPVISGFSLQYFTSHVLGDNWTLELVVIITFGYSELFRAIYFIQVNRLLHGGDQHNLHFFTALFMLFVGACAGLMAFFTNILIIVPAGMLFGYITVTLRLSAKIRAETTWRNE